MITFWVTIHSLCNKILKIYSQFSNKRVKHHYLLRTARTQQTLLTAVHSRRISIHSCLPKRTAKTINGSSVRAKTPCDLFALLLPSTPKSNCLPKRRTIGSLRSAVQRHLSFCAFPNWSDLFGEYAKQRIAQRVGPQHKDTAFSVHLSAFCLRPMLI